MKTQNKPQKDPLAGLEEGSIAHSVATRAIVDSKLSPLDRKSTKTKAPEPVTKLPESFKLKKGSIASNAAQMATIKAGHPALRKSRHTLVNRINKQLSKSPTKKK